MLEMRLETNTNMRPGMEAESPPLAVFSRQMKAGDPYHSFYVSKDSLPWVYSLGGWGDDDYPMAGNLCLAIHRDVYPANGVHVLKAAKEGPTHTALIEVHSLASSSDSNDVWLWCKSYGTCVLMSAAGGWGGRHAQCGHVVG